MFQLKRKMLFFNEFMLCITAITSNNFKKVERLQYFTILITICIVSAETLNHQFTEIGPFKAQHALKNTHIGCVLLME